MNTQNSIEIISWLAEWSETVGDVNLVSKDSEKIRLKAKAKGIEKLIEFRQLKSLLCFQINQELLKHICSCGSLENLYIDSFKAKDISCFQRLEFLKVLSLESCSIINNLSEISKLQKLQGLAIVHFKNVHKIEALSKLTNLRQLKISGSMWTRMNIETLKPLSSLSNLEYLNLTNLKVKDESLKPLANLSRLEQLDIANFYPMEEFAWLAGKLKNTKCGWFSSYIDSYSKCPKCNKDKMVMLTGKGKRNLCRECDYKRLERHIKEFEIIASESNRT